MHLYSLLMYHITKDDWKIKMDGNGTDNDMLAMQMLTSDKVGLSSDETTMYLHPLYSQGKQEAHIRESDPVMGGDNWEFYLIDKLLVPPWMNVEMASFVANLESTLSSQECYSAITHLLVASDLESDVREKGGDFTLIAPSDKGFQDSLVTSLMEPGNEAGLSEFVRYHMLPRVLNIRELQVGSSLHTTMQGETVRVKVTRRRGIYFNDASLKGYELARDGIVYRTDQILIPPSWRGANSP